jgi:flagellar basal-body rod modification protein FlgD
MTSPTISSATATNPQTSTQTPKTTTTGFGDNFNTFLTMLTTQLKNQDPLSPLDGNQFTEQLVQFSQVEQSIKGNDSLSKLVAMQSTNQMISATPLVGRQVEYSGDTTALAGGQAQWSYTMPSSVVSGKLTITDSDGNVVYSTDANPTAGKHAFAWDGTNVLGTPVPDGAYTLTVTANKSDNTLAAATVTTVGKVGAVFLKDGAAQLDMGSGISIGLDKVASVGSS